MIPKRRQPWLYGSIVLVFPTHISDVMLADIMSQSITYNRYPETIEMVWVEVDCVYSFEIDDLLTKLFEKCDIMKIQEIIARLKGKVLIDISFHHYDDIYPALLFEGKNMEIIHMLNADISIDPY